MASVSGSVGAGQPGPGEVASSLSGQLRAMVHHGFPGVLLGVDAPLDRIQILRLDLAATSAGWVVVRTADPVRLEDGLGAAYDQEVEPGRSYLYRLGYGQDEHDVTVTLPDWEGWCGAWLKHLSHPDLSVAIPRAIAAHDLSIGTWVSAVDAISGGRSVTDAVGAQLPTGSMTITTRSEPDYRALMECVTTPGVMLLQAAPAHGIDPAYIVRTRVVPSRPGDFPGWAFRQVAIEWQQVERPVLDLDAPPVVPGWTWDRHTGGVGFEAWALTYGTEWSLLAHGASTPWVPSA